MNKLKALISCDRKILRIGDLAALWSESNHNTLYTSIKRYVASEKLYRIQKGLYSTVRPDTLDPLYLARKLINGYCYLSLESILFLAGYRSQVPSSFTFVATKSSDLSWRDIHVKTHQLADRYLFNDKGIYLDGDSILKATTIRAICDTLYYNPLAHFDKDVDWEEVREFQGQLGYKITDRKS